MSGSASRIGQAAAFFFSPFLTGFQASSKNGSDSETAVGNSASGGRGIDARVLEEGGRIEGRRDPSVLRLFPLLLSADTAKR